jgi:CRP-like cAMP-binding protein
MEGACTAADAGTVTYVTLASDFHAMDRAVRAAWIARVPALSGLPEDALGRLATASVRRSLRRGDALVRVREPFDALAVVVSGRLDVVLHRMRLRGLLPGASVGLSLVAGARASASVLAAERETVVLLVPGRAVRAELARDPAASLRAVAALGELVERLTEELVEAQTLTLEERVLRHVARLAAGRREVLTTQQAIADALGASRERVNRALAALERRGRIARARGRIRTSSALGS